VAGVLWLQLDADTNGEVSGGGHGGQSSTDRRKMTT
jgi:hypothetical protein